MTVVISPHPRGIATNLRAYIGPELFEKYRSVCRSYQGKYEPATQSNVFAIEHYDELKTALTEAGLRVEVVGDVRPAPSSAPPASPEADPRPTVTLAYAPGATDAVTLTLQGYATPERFDAYRGICLGHGGRYDPQKKWTVIDARRANAVAAALERSGYRVELAGDPLPEVPALRLYPHQRAGVAWLAVRRRALLWDEMGLGKTAQALLALPPGRPVLVAAPKAVVSVWLAEARRWRPDYRAAAADHRAPRWPEPGEILVASYSTLPVMTSGPLSATVLIADEAHYIKNRRAQRTQKWAALRDAVRRDASSIVWALTGTPLLTHPPDLWGVLQAAGLEREALGSWPQFVDLFDGRMVERGRRRWMVWGRPDPSVPERLRRVSLRRTRREVLPDLPTKAYREIRVRVDRDAVAASAEALAALAERGLELDDLEALRRDKVAFSQISSVRASLCTAKIPALLDLVETYEESEEPVVVFSAHRAPIDALAGREGWAVITGDTPAAERSRAVEAFQAGALRGIAGTTGAMGVGVTLTRASHVIVVDRDWTPAANAQAEDRVCRIGQDRGVLITDIVAEGTLDERVASVLRTKQALIAGIGG
ncbi:MAG: DEAD/DEAH box helicase [Armatimonadota bacterium]|nr:DEAD/DEAH box helicase [Armatimonadota bacterium]